VGEDREAFEELVLRHQPEIRVHCYRMLGSWHEAEDLAQETFLRAWRGRETYRGPGSYRAWLYQIATRACLDVLKRHRRRIPAMRDEHAAPHLPPAPAVVVPWLQPCPDEVLDAAAGAGDGETDAPGAAALAKETVELAFLAAVQHLPPRRRAVLILRDVLGWSAQETADALETSVASVNSALQRARPALRQHLPARRLDWSPAQEPTDAEREIVARYIAALERADQNALAALLRDDVRASHQPGAGGHMGAAPAWYTGRQTLVEAWAPVMGDGPRIRLVPTRANRQPAVAAYIRLPGEADFRAFALTVLTLAGGRIAEATTFGAENFAAFGLPARRGGDEF
jgi:RNA polymerase sigma-70 factor (ECF subfamily)